MTFRMPVLFGTTAMWLLTSIDGLAWQRAHSRRSKAAVMTFQATANSIGGITKSGLTAKEGLVAADPAILLLGSRIRVTGAGAYSGVYTVADTGEKVKGRRIDLYVRTTAEARQFGKRIVKVRVLFKAPKVSRSSS